MTSENLIQRYRHWYAKLLRLYSKPFYESFGEGMVQTFTDLLRARAAQERALLGYVLWMFAETGVNIMEDNMTHLLAQNKNIVRWALVTGGILMVPLVAMQVTEEVQWNLFDFIVMGALLFGMGLAYELIAKQVHETVYRVAFGFGLGGAFLLVWVNGAVGIIGHEDNPANLLYGGVFVVGAVGALLARFKPHGMSWTLFVAAGVQLLVPVVALLVWPPSVASWSPGVLEVFALNGVFAALFVVSAVLFRRATEADTCIAQ